jgi:hypothetical protein
LIIEAADLGVLFLNCFLCLPDINYFNGPMPEDFVKLSNLEILSIGTSSTITNTDDDNSLVVLTPIIISLHCTCSSKYPDRHLGY